MTRSLMKRTFMLLGTVGSPLEFCSCVHCIFALMSLLSGSAEASVSIKSAAGNDCQVLLDENRPRQYLQEITNMSSKFQVGGSVIVTNPDLHNPAQRGWREPFQEYRGE